MYIQIEKKHKQSFGCIRLARTNEWLYKMWLIKQKIDAIDDVFGVQIFLAKEVAIQKFFVLDSLDDDHHFSYDDDV